MFNISVITHILNLSPLPCDSPNTEFRKYRLLLCGRAREITLLPRCSKADDAISKVESVILFYARPNCFQVLISLDAGKVFIHL